MTRLVYILAASHSGSTLLAMLLGAHPEACTAGELKANPKSFGDPNQYRCSCGQPIKTCQFWRRLSAAMQRRGCSFEITAAGTDFRTVDSAYARRLLAPMHRGRVLETVRDVALGCSPTWRSALPAIQQRNATLAATLTELTNARLIVDSSKIAVRLKFLLRNPDVDVRIVRLIRDGRGVALTYVDPARFADARDTALRGGGNGRNRDAERLSIEQAALEWRRNNEEAEHVLATCDRSRWIEVRYEDVCGQTSGTLERIFRFLDLDPARAVLDFRAAEQHVVGNGMRLDSSSTIELDERWRSALTAADLETFDNIAGEMNRRYGYE